MNQMNIIPGDIMTIRYNWNHDIRKDELVLIIGVSKVQTMSALPEIGNKTQIIYYDVLLANGKIKIIDSWTVEALQKHDGIMFLNR
jgi:hypothetical protein